LHEILETNDLSVFGACQRNLVEADKYSRVNNGTSLTSILRKILDSSLASSSLRTSSAAYPTSMAVASSDLKKIPTQRPPPPPPPPPPGGGGGGGGVDRGLRTYF
jgi:hypothetical protein